ncbi:hypothetical protein GCM10020331_012030 [Ectobacillus funiculus]
MYKHDKTFNKEVKKIKKMAGSKKERKKRKNPHLAWLKNEKKVEEEAFNMAKERKFVKEHPFKLITPEPKKPTP